MLDRADDDAASEVGQVHRPVADLAALTRKTLNGLIRGLPKLDLESGVWCL
jgi:hypothetical protein